MNKIKVLLVEDETSLAMILSDTLEAQGFEMRTANDGEEGLRMFDEQKPDVLVADVMMPKMDGFEMVRRIRKTDSRTPVLFLTARSAVNDVVEGFELGGNDYLKKPFAIQELIFRIKSLCHRVSAGNIFSEEQEGGNVSPDNPDAAGQWLSIGRYRLNVASHIEKSGKHQITDHPAEWFDKYFKDAFDALIDGEEELFFYKILTNHFIPNPPHIDDSDIFIGR